MSKVENSVGSSGVYLSDVSPADKPWDEHRANADVIRDSYKLTEYHRYADRIQTCSQRLLFALRTNEKAEKVLLLDQALFCRVRHCPVCQWRRSLVWRARFFQAIPRILADYPGYKFIFLTLTVKNCLVGELRETIAQMNLAWKRLTERKIFPAVGWVKSVEVTRRPNNEAHPHFHAILMVKQSYFTSKAYIPKEKWREIWQSCLRIDYLPVVNIKAVRQDFSKSNNNAKIDQLAVALCETLKYSVKEQDLMADPKWLASITEQLHKTRAIALGGIFKKYLSEEEPEDLINTGLLDEILESEEEVKFWFGWREMIKRYQSL